jgi:hypothetical protein
MTIAEDLANTLARLEFHRLAAYPADREMELLTEALLVIADRVAAMESAVGLAHAVAEADRRMEALGLKAEAARLQ